VVTQAEIGRRAGTDVSTVNKILNGTVSPFRKETVKEVLKVARTLGYDFGKLKYQHRRRHPRTRAGPPLELKVYGPDGSLHDRGKAQLRDLSLCGALISALVLGRRTLPLGPCRMGIRVSKGPAKGVEILGRPVRIVHAPEGTGVGIEFFETEEGKAKRLLSATP